MLFSYLNPLLAAGPDALRRAADAGFSGVLVTDLPLGADAEREAWLGNGPLAFVRLVAPTTPVERMREIARHGRGFVYLISRTGVTGMQESLPSDLRDHGGAPQERLRVADCGRVRHRATAQAAAVGRLADGVVVGSALVHAADTGGVRAAEDLTRALRTALDSRAG